MRQLTRLLRYVAPYWWQLLSSVLLMAAVGLLDAFRVLLIGPIFDRVLNPSSPSHEMQLFKVPFSGNTIYLQQFVPSHFRNPWNVVAFALVVATILKGIFDYAGTYLVNYAGFGMITDLRNELYNSILRRSSAFYQKHTTGTLISTIVNDIERVQFAMSSVLAEFRQQLFTLIFTAFVVVLLGGKLAWVLLLFVPFTICSAGRIGMRVRLTTRKGQDKLADIQNILHETITGNRIVKAFSMESWEIARFAKAAQRLFRANLRSVAAAAISSPLMDIFGAIAIALILLFFDVTAGRLLIDGRDVRDTTLSSLRSQIGVVTQETVLFNDTLRNNIAYGQPAISQKQVEAAARAALAHDFIMGLPAGYDTMIGDRGVRLSGGERQRIAIARALLKNAPILILDEATSALDSESEALVQSALQNLMSGRTVVVIAHRLSTVRRADRIVVIENGGIADIGTHEELVQKLGTYRRLYDLQFIDIEAPRVGAHWQSKNLGTSNAHSL